MVSFTGYFVIANIFHKAKMLRSNTKKPMGQAVHSFMSGGVGRAELPTTNAP